MMAELERVVTAALVESLGRGVTSKHKQAAVELVRIVGDDAVDMLGALLVNADSDVKHGVVEILGVIGGRKVAGVLAGALKDAMIQEQVVSALVSLGVEAIGLLITILCDPKPDNGQSVDTLGTTEDSWVAESPILLLYDTNGRVRWAAARALAAIGQSAIQPLIATLYDAAPEVREAAADALRYIGDPRALPHLEQLVGHLRCLSPFCGRSAILDAYVSSSDSRSAP
jgi:HEAT repeat protein